MKTIYLICIIYSNGWEPYTHYKEYAFCSNKTDALKIKMLLNKLTNEQAHKLKLLFDKDDEFIKAYVVPRTIDNQDNIIKKLTSIVE
jgi:hypothetical protein